MVVLFCLFVWGEGEDDIDFFLQCTRYVFLYEVFDMYSRCFSMSLHLGDEVFDMYSMFEG